MTVDLSYKYSELSEAIIGAFYEVYNELGHGFLESVYRNSLQLALLAKGLQVETEVAVPVFFRGKNVGGFRADMVINGCLLLELKTAEAIIIAHEAQLLNYLRATNLEVGLVLNFGPKAQVRRLAYDNTRKKFKSQRAGVS
ncbi:MAG: GxxExxY protein [Candidatus Angelobacter sp.]